MCEDFYLGGGDQITPSRHKKMQVCFVSAFYFHTFAPRIGSEMVIRRFGLKGNQVKVLDSPAAVKLVNALWHMLIATNKSSHEKLGRRQRVSQSEDLPFIKGYPPRGLGA